MTKKKLPVLGKSLMPEVLPDPKRMNPKAGSARARVRSRLQQIKDNAAIMGAAAAIAACGSGNKYNVVDELPSPAGRGAGGRPGSTAGYGVVDPLPSPAGYGGVGGPQLPAAGVSGSGLPAQGMMCSAANLLDTTSARAEWRSTTTLLFSINLVSTAPATAVKVTQVISNAMNATDVSAGIVPFKVVLESSPWPERTYIKLSVVCESAAQRTTESLTFDIDASKPAAAGEAPVTLRIAAESDAGAP